VIETEQITVDGLRTRVCVAGAGEPLFVIHGGEFGMLYSLDAWDLAIRELESDFAVVAFDRVGQGGTDNPKSADEYTFSNVLAHAIRSLELLCSGQALVVGHSRGGLVAARLAQQRPDLVRTLTIVASNSLAPSDPATPRDFYAKLEARLPNGYQTLDDVCIEPLAQSYSSSHVTNEFAMALLRHARLAKTREAQAVMRTIKVSHWYPDLEDARALALADIDKHGFEIPTGIIWGLHDPSAPVMLGVRLLSRLAPRTPQACLHVLAQSGHYSFREQPRIFGTLVRAICSGDRM
jgi:2-hydroxy-6-oxo-octa-2,4-dienoate hydrolase